MDSNSSFSRHFSRLVWLLVHQPERTSDIADSLQPAMAELAGGRLHIVLADVSFAVAAAFQQSQMSISSTWLGELSVRMSAHSAREIEFETFATPGDVLGVARALSEDPAPGDDGAAFDAKLVALAPIGIAVHIGAMGFVRRTSPPASLEVIDASPPGVIHEEAEAGHVGRRLTPVTSAALDMANDPDVPEGGAAANPATGLSVEEPIQVGDRWSRSNEEYARRLEPAESGSEFTAALDPSANRLRPRDIDDIARQAEERALSGHWMDLAEVLAGFHERLEALADGDEKRAYLVAIRRLEKPALARGIAQLLPKHRDKRDMLIGLLSRSGDAAADALLDLLVSSENASERSAYRAALAHNPAAVPALLHLLSDGRWYVVRNAVELLGELAPPDADTHLAQAMSHADPRVRRAAAASLARLGTARAILALLQGIHDPSPDVRLQIALGLGAVRNTRAVPWLVEALDRERDLDVQAAMIAALGRMPTEEAVQRLARSADGGGLLVRRSATQRLQAVEALGEANSDSAKKVLQSLVNDRDDSVREAANRALRGLTVPHRGE